MKSRIRMKVLFLAIPIVFISSHLFAFDPAVDCPSFYSVSTFQDIKDAVVADKYPDNTPYLKGNEYIVCLQPKWDESIGADEILEIEGRDKPIIIYNLFLRAAEMPPFGNSYGGLFLSVKGLDVTLNYVRIENATTAIEIAGSNVEIVDSQIGVTRAGILVGDAEKERINNITIKNSTIAGPGVSAECDQASLENCSIGLKIRNADNVKIIDNPDTIEGFDIGVDGKANVEGTTFKNVGIPVNNSGPVVDISTVGKKLDDKKEKATRIAGLAPIEKNICDGDESKYGHVDLYNSEASAKVGNIILYETGCAISRFKKGDSPLCLYYGFGKVPEDEEECRKSSECECYDYETQYPHNTCIFDCADISVNADRYAIFSYVDGEGITYKFSNPRTVNNLPDIVATFAPATPLPAGDELIDDAESDDDGGDKTSASGGASNVEMPGDTAPDAPLGDGMGGGIGRMIDIASCSLSAGAPFASIPTLVLAILMSMPIVVRALQRRKK